MHRASGITTPTGARSKCAKLEGCATRKGRYEPRLRWYLGANKEPPRRTLFLRAATSNVPGAYDGRMTFYVTDTSEPLIAAYTAIFPTLFRPISEMPASLQDNIRYPEDLFSVQAEAYRTYHMTDPREFYNKEDVWAWPEDW